MFVLTFNLQRQKAAPQRYRNINAISPCECTHTARRAWPDDSVEQLYWIRIVDCIPSGLCYLLWLRYVKKSCDSGKQQSMQLLIDLGLNRLWLGYMHHPIAKSAQR